MGGFLADSSHRCSDRGGTVATESIDGVMMNCVTGLFGICGRRGTRQLGMIEEVMTVKIGARHQP